MVETGVLDEDDRIELVQGVLVDMVPIGAEHDGATAWLNRRFGRVETDAWEVRVQSTFLIAGRLPPPRRHAGGAAASQRAADNRAPRRRGRPDVAGARPREGPRLRRRRRRPSTGSSTCSLARSSCTEPRSPARTRRSRPSPTATRSRRSSPARQRSTSPGCSADRRAQAAARSADPGRSRSAWTTASSALVSASRWPSVTASITARLRCSTPAICSSIVSEASR